jgi:curved DNA-binding protein CbpA
MKNHQIPDVGEGVANEHEVLGVEKGADIDELKQAYAQRVEKTHPSAAEDGSAEEFERVREAYEVLMERQARSADEYPSDVEVPKVEGREDGEDDELREKLKFGWRIYHTPDHDFYVARDRRDEDDENLYIDPEGQVRDKPTYFNRYLEANIGFSRFLKHRKEEIEESRDRMRVNEEYQEEWGSSEIERKIDGFWYLTYQESEPLGDEKRWAVSCRDKGVYVGPGGALTDEPFWFGSEDDAMEAHEEYLKNADEIGSLRHLGLSLMYGVFILPVKAIELLVKIFFSPVKFVDAVFNTQLRMLSGAGRRVSYVAEGVVLSGLVLAAFWIHWLLGFFAFLYLGSALVYWTSPYEPSGPMARPRWTRRNREVSTYEPHIRDSSYEPLEEN